MNTATVQKYIDKSTYIDLDSLSVNEIGLHPYQEIFALEAEMCEDYDLVPSIFLYELLAYHDRATLLQDANLIRDKSIKSGDDLQDNVHIYDTINRWYAGFSNAPQEMWLGPENPKHDWNIEHGFATTGYRNKFTNAEWFYLLLIHRITGSGASFAAPGAKLAPHGWCNTPMPYLCENSTDMYSISMLLKNFNGPIFTSIGNQIPPFNKPTGNYTQGGRQYLVEYAPKLAAWAYLMLCGAAQGDPMGIQECVTKVLEKQKGDGHKQFKFVLTAWVMDLAEYFPNLVNPDSDCFHGKNAIESINLIFKPSAKMPKQKFYDNATRYVADMTITRPMDVEDVYCDFIRWLENYYNAKTYKAENFFHKCYVKYQNSRQRWK